MVWAKKGKIAQKETEWSHKELEIFHGCFLYCYPTKESLLQLLELTVAVFTSKQCPQNLAAKTNIFEILSSLLRFLQGQCEKKGKKL